MPNVLTDDEDELELDDPRRQTIGKPLVYGPQEPANVKAETSPMPTPKPSSTPLPADTPPPDVGATSNPASSTIAGVAPYKPNPEVAAPRPAQQAFTDWQAQDLQKHPAGQPRYHGLARVADTIAGATNIGRAVEAGGELGTYGAEAKQNRLAKGAQLENEQIKEGEQERQANAQTEGEVAKTQTEKTGAELQTTPSGLNVMTKNVAPIVVGQERAQTALGVQGLKNEGATGLEQQKEDYGSDLQSAKTGLANAQTDLAKFRANPNSPMYRIAQEHLRIAQGNYALSLKKYGFDYDPSTLSPDEQATLPTDQAGNPVGLHSPLKPSGQTVNAAQRASNVVSQIPRLTQEIQDLQSQLGPGVGRWNRFWQGDVGVADPKFAHLADDMEFMASAVALAHAYGRLPTSISDKFDKMFQAGKQDPANMLAAMQVAGEWLPKIAQGGQTAGEKAGGAGGAGAPKAPPAKQRFGDFRRQQFGGVH
jgi:hypothetical protein